VKEFLHRIFRSEKKPGQEALKSLDYYQETFEVDQERGILIDGQIKIAPLSRRPKSKKIPVFFSAPGDVSFLRESAGIRKPPAGFKRTKETTRLTLSLEEGEGLLVGEGSVFKIVDIIDPFTLHLVCRYTSPNKFKLEKVYEGDFDLKSYEIKVAGRWKIFLSSSPQRALSNAENDYYHVDRGSVREIEFSEGFERMYRLHKKGVNVPFRLFEYFGLAALYDSSFEGDIGIPKDFYELTGKPERKNHSSKN